MGPRAAFGSVSCLSRTLNSAGRHTPRFANPAVSRPFTIRSMFCRATRPFCIALASFSLIAGSLALRAQDDDSHHGRKYKVPPPSATIAVTVVRAYNGKPISDAHVI